MTPTPLRRRGVILVVVLGLLSLFAAVSLTFFLYAQSQAAAARAALASETPTRANVDPDLLASYFLGQFLYDVSDERPGVTSALRGHSLARSLYGLDSGGTNDLPYNGTGRLHGPGPFTFPAPPDTPRAALDDYYLINYTHFPADNFLRDPERLGHRPSLDAPRGPFRGGFNASYTYPDLNNLYLAAAKADGRVLLPSYHRPWLFGSNDPANPNWTNTTGKYLLLRPRPAEMGPGFPYPEDPGGDVKNLEDAPGGNDSYWLDLGFPVMTAPNGRKFKPLFAPLVLDLDSRLNLNVHGNARAVSATGQPTHASHQGWGPWEVNLSRVLTKADKNGPEWLNLLRRRLGPDGVPGQAGTALRPFAAGRPYSRTDLDACRPTAKGSVVTDLRPILPPLMAFPVFPPGWESGSESERTGHPALAPAGDDHTFAPSALEHLLASGAGGILPQASEPGALCPRSLADARIRNLVTLLSADLDRPAVTPWVWDRSIAPYRLRPGQAFPTGGEMPSPLLTSSPPPGSDFGPDGRSRSARLGRIALDRPLPPYPTQANDLAGHVVARSARIDLARALYDRLRAATGAAEPSTAPGTEFDALRCLAQLAVNIVDAIDEDDVMTPFLWHQSPLHGAQHVIGTELPRVVVNEVYAEASNDPAGADRPIQVRFWIELLNPLPADPSLSVRLDGPGYAVYRLMVASSPCSSLDRPDNVLGEPISAEIRSILAHYAPAAPPPPGVNPTLIPSGNGFVVLGPAESFPGTDPGRPLATLRTPGGLTYQLPPGTTADTLPEHTVLLQRLACPTLPPNPLPGASLDPHRPYNPYVTVDYVVGVPTNDGIEADARGPRQPMDVSRRTSVGRAQPYAAHATQRRSQTPAPPLAGQPQHTLHRHNGDPISSYQWLAHLDRPPVSPAELLGVSGYAPHRLTQRFQSPAGAYGHRAPWLDPTSRLYRFLEFVRCRPLSSTPPGGRLSGQININTLWDPDVFLALCDPQPANTFRDSDLFRPLGYGLAEDPPSNPQTLFNRLLAARTPDLTTGGGPGPDDRPILSMAAPFVASGDEQYPSGSGLDRTLLQRFDLAGSRLLLQPPTAPDAHPSVATELLTKVFNHLTTRSHIFAVWVTVGFFEVTDATTQPVKLGPEVGKTQGRHVRYRIFSVIDRSQMARLRTTTAVATPEGDATIRLVDSLGPVPPPPGTLLSLGAGADEETVVVLSANDKQVTARLARSHPKGTPVVWRGNPGPQPRLNHHDHWPVIVVTRLWRE